MEVPHQLMDVNGQTMSHDPSNENLEDDESSLLVISFSMFYYSHTNHLQMMKKSKI